MGVVRGTKWEIGNAGIAVNTLVLMGDGTIKPISELQVGNAVTGISRVGRYNRFVQTTVDSLEFKSSPMFQVTAGTTELVAAPTQVVLTNRGWKHVFGTEHGDQQRPHLTVNNRLLGFTALAPPPVAGQAYRRGYLTGMIRGDGTIGTYTYRRRSGAQSVVHRFRLALVDEEALERSACFLSDEGIETTRFCFAQASETRRQVWAIRTSRRDDIEAIRRLIRWPEHPTEAWRRGYLAGIFDAEGSRSHSILRIANSDEAILDRISKSLTSFGFDSVMEPPHANGVTNVRLRGGVSEQIRFMSLVDPAVLRKRSVIGVALKSMNGLFVESVELLEARPSCLITTSVGTVVANGLICYAGPASPALASSESSAANSSASPLGVIR